MHQLLQSLDLPNLPEQAIHFGLRLAAALVLVLIGFWLIARIANLFRRALERGHLDSTLTGFLRNVVYGILFALLLVAALEFAGLPSASLITALGAAGLAIGLALQGSLSNLAWGVLLILFRPFRVGDMVQFGSIQGTVERVDLMQTYLIMPDNRQAIVPNAKVGSDAIITQPARHASFRNRGRHWLQGRHRPRDGGGARIVRGRSADSGKTGAGRVGGIAGREQRTVADPRLGARQRPVGDADRVHPRAEGTLRRRGHQPAVPATRGDGAADGGCGDGKP